MVQDILSKLDGIIITKTKTNPEVEHSKKSQYIYRCNFCSLQFTNLMPLYHHKIFNHGQDQYRHRILNKMKKRQATERWVDSIPSIGNDLPNVALKIDYTRKRKRVKNKVVKPILKCDKCPKIFRSDIVYQQHKNRHEGIKNYYCEKCGKGFYFNAALKTHSEVHNETRDFVCDVCSKTFKGKVHLEAHKRLHPVENFICHVCGKSVRHSMSLKMHMLCHSTERKFKCNFCELCFKRKTELRSHTRLHTDERPFQCSSCDESFRTSNALKTHLVKVHLKVRNFQCDICDKRFFTQKNLKQHTHTHTAYRIPCTLCDKAFKLQKSLMRHVRLVHENIRNFECEVCNKRFRENHGLKMHMSVHSNERFQCPKCQKLFKLASTLKVHMDKRHTDAQAYVCNYCKCAFENVDDVQTHECVILMRDESLSNSS